MPPAAAAQPAAAPELADQVEVRRTAYGIPHIRAENLRAAGYALAYVQLEDYGERVVRGLVGARGELGLHYPDGSVDADFQSRRRHGRARETYDHLEEDTREVLEGFAAGVNRYMALHPEEFPEGVRPMFTGVDVHALGIGTAEGATVRRFLQRMAARGDRVLGDEVQAAHPEDGSNSWAFAPSRTTSGSAILMRNPHLSWDAGYYEVQITVPGKLNFYGDFRIGGPLGIVGGFNERLGWSTSNNSPQLEEIYVLRADPQRPDRYHLDGGSHPLQREEVTVERRRRGGIERETREFWRTSLGPVIHRTGEQIYIVRSADDGEFRMGEQFLRLMQARDLEEWKEAMRMRARTASNFVYADADGNIFYVWNAALPSLPHPSGGATFATPVSRTSQVWSDLVPFDSLPQLLNPRGGYVRNENDPFHFTNLHEPLKGDGIPPNTPAPRLGLRSQLGLDLVHGEDRLSLEEVVARKHSMRMLLADRVKDDLIAAVRAASPTDELLAAADLLERWDNTAAPTSRGGVLFERWWERYRTLTPGGRLFATEWTADEPISTPRGLARPGLAAEAFAWAVEETARQFGGWDVSWGEVHRVRRGEVDVPVGGCSGALGCFRVLSFEDAEDGRRVANRGDAWVLAVEFTDPVRAYTVLAYGQSAREDSPHYSDQAEMFARNRMKPVAFTEEDIERTTIRRYRPGREMDR